METKSSIDVIRDTVLMLARNSVPFQRQLRVHGLLVVSADDTPSIATHIDQRFSAPMSNKQRVTTPPVQHPRVKEEIHGKNMNGGKQVIKTGFQDGGKAGNKGNDQNRGKEIVKSNNQSGGMMVIKGNSLDGGKVEVMKGINQDREEESSGNSLNGEKVIKDNSQNEVKEETKGNNSSEEGFNSSNADMSGDATGAESFTELPMMIAIQDSGNNVVRSLSPTPSFKAEMNRVGAMSPVKPPSGGMVSPAKHGQVSGNSNSKRLPSPLASPLKKGVDQGSIKRQRLSLEQNVTSPMKSPQQGGRNPVVRKNITSPPRARSLSSKSPPMSPSVTRSRGTKANMKSPTVGGGTECAVIAKTTYACNLCENVYQNLSSLQRHQTTSHGRAVAPGKGRPRKDSHGNVNPTASRGGSVTNDKDEQGDEEGYGEEEGNVEGDGEQEGNVEGKGNVGEGDVEGDENIEREDETMETP